MNTSEEEHTADDAETADRGKAVHTERDGTASRHLDLISTEEPTERAILRLKLLPDSEERIISMVEREQGYEKAAAQTRFLLTIFQFVFVTVGGILLFVLAFDSNQKSNWPWQILIPFATALGGYALRGSLNGLRIWRSEGSNDPGRDAPDD